MRTRPLTANYIRQIDVIRHLQAQRPETIRNSITLFMYRIICFFAGIIFIIWGAAVFISSAVAAKAVHIITTQQPFFQLHPERIANFAGIVLVITGLLCLLISNFAAKLMHRNRYILELEDAVQKI